MYFGSTPPRPLDLNSGNVLVNWKTFKQRYLSYEIATGISGRCSWEMQLGDAADVATLLTVIGNEALDVYDTFVCATVGDEKKIAKVLEKFDEQYEPRKKVTYERYIFFTKAHEISETIDQCVTTLQRMNDTCEFGRLRDTVIKD